MKRNSKRKMARTCLALLLCGTVVWTTPSAGKLVQATENYGTSSTDSTDGTNVDPNGVLGKNSDIGISVTKSITGKAGKKVKVAFNIKSNDTTNIKLKSVYPVIDNAFPFETSGDAYKVVSAGSDADKQKSMDVQFTMTTRSNIETGYQSVRFIGEYTKTDTDGTTSDYYVIKTINIYFTGTTASGGSDSSGSSGGASSKTPTPSYTDDDDDDDDTPSYSGGGSSGGSSYSGGSDSESEPTAPKLLITGFETKPEKIMAGQTFELTVHLQNTSKTTAVCNGKFLIGNEAGNFIPTSGSSAVFVEKIEAGKTGDLKIEMKTSADLAQKNYSLVVKGDFDDGKGNQFTSSDSLSVPVYQEVKLAITDITLSPEMIGVGTEASLMFTVNNQGNAGVYNVNVSVDDPAVTAEESYVGNIAAASSAYATLNLTGVQTNTDSGKIKVIVSYEDAEGTKGTLEQDVDCTVEEEVSMLSDDLEGDYEEDEETGVPVWLIILLSVLAVAVIVVVVIILVKRKKKKEAELFEDDDDEFGEDDIEDENF